MRTPAEYSKNLKNHVITMQMLLECLYSSNKRAKTGVTKKESGVLVGMTNMTMNQRLWIKRKSTIVRKRQCFRC